VVPLRLVSDARQQALTGDSTVPVWFPDPLPIGWTFAGMALLGSDDSGYCAAVTAFEGPAPLGGQGEWLIVAEEPSAGIGNAYGHVHDLPSQLPPPGTAPSKIHALGHPTPLWALPSDREDRSVYVGEAGGIWLWVIGFPADAGYAVMENIALSDRRYVDGPIPMPEKHCSRLRPGSGV
jgi:hypothetical protein